MGLPIFLNQGLAGLLPSSTGLIGDDGASSVSGIMEHWKNNKKSTATKRVFKIPTFDQRNTF